MSTIITKNSSVASAVPTPADLEQGELAVNVTDKRLFTENASGSVVELGTNPTSITTGAITSTGVSVGNLSISSGTITDSSGSISFGNENISTTGTLASGNFSVTGNISVTGTVDGIDVSDAVTFSASDVSSASWVIDEDAMSSDSDTKVPTQQSVKTYVDNTVIAIGAVTVDPTPVANDFAKFTNSTELTGRSYSEVRTDLGLVIGTDVQAYDSNLTDFVTTFTLPTVDGTSGQALTTNGSGVIGFTTIDTDPTLGTLDQSFTTNQQTIITLSSAVSAGVPNVSVTKEVPQTGVTNNQWDVNSTAENYTRVNSAPATTLDFVGFDVSTASFVDSFSVASEETFPQGIAFNNDGTKMFIVGYTGDDVNEYTLSSGFDVSTATYSQNFSVASQESTPTGIAFNNDGTKMFIVGTSGQDVNEYTLGTGFDVSTASFVDSFSVAAQETTPLGLAFNNDGTKMFIVGTAGDDVNEYTLGTGFDVSTASYSQNFSVASQETSPEGIAFNNDGTKMFIVGSSGDDVNEYTLGTGFDVSTASYSQNFSVASQETVPTGIAFNNDGTKMFIVGSAGDDVNEYDLSYSSVKLGTGSFTSADVGKTIYANSGELILTSTGGAFVETTAPSSYAQVASGNWEMYAVVYNTTDGDLELSGGLYGAGFDINALEFVQTFSVSAQETNPEDIAFNTDGTKMFIIGSTGDDVNEYTLSTAYDISTATFVDSFSVASQESVPRGIAFNNDGTLMFVVGLVQATVYSYTLSAFDVSTANYSDSFVVSSQDTNPESIRFNNDGTKMFILGDAGNDVNEYTLSSAYDISTASFVDSFSVASQETDPYALAFNSDGTKMFVGGNSGDDVNEYTLTNGFDVSTASYSQTISTDIPNNPKGIVFGNQGKKMYIVSSGTDNVHEYNTASLIKPSGYHAAHSTDSIDSTYWTDINSMTADESAGSGNVYYAVSTDDRATWSIADNTDGIRDIVRNNAGTWEYNSNSTYGSETWTAASTNTELSALQESMAEAKNQMDKTQLEAVTDANHFTLGNDLDLAIIFNLSSGSTVPSSDGVSINYDANTLNEGAILGTDYDFDFPATDKVRITALADNNLKVRVV